MSRRGIVARSSSILKLFLFSVANGVQSVTITGISRTLGLCVVSWDTFTHRIPDEVLTMDKAMEQFGWTQ